MRYEARLTAIYDRFLAAPGNANVPNLSADEAVYEVALQQQAHAALEDVTSWRRTVRLIQQNQWLTRFIRAWEYFERTS